MTNGPVNTHLKSWIYTHILVLSMVFHKMRKVAHGHLVSLIRDMPPITAAGGMKTDHYQNLPMQYTEMFELINLKIFSI